MTIFDTNVIIGFTNRDPDSKGILERYADGRRIGISSISCYEIFNGIRPSEESKVENFSRNSKFTS